VILPSHGTGKASLKRLVKSIVLFFINIKRVAVPNPNKLSSLFPNLSVILDSEIPEEKGIIELSAGMGGFIQFTSLAVNVPSLLHLNVDDSLLHPQLFIGLSPFCLYPM